MIERILAAASATPWAIEEEKLDAIAAFLGRRAEGHLTEDEILARLGGPAPQPRQASTGRGVAVLPLFGVISHRMGSMASISGGTSTEAFAASFRAAMENPEVGTIVLDVDSPGGTVSGVPELAREIAAARGQKRVIAVANGLMASAAYWLASGAEEIVATLSSRVGDIGVFWMHMDRSGASERAGVKTTVIRAGRFKAERNPYEPLTEETRAALQAEVDEYYELFVADVARNRGDTPASVRSGYGEGRSLIAAKALKANLVDRVATLDEILAELGIEPSRLRAASSPKLAATSVIEGPLALELAEPVIATAASSGGEASATPTPEPAPEAKEITVETNTAAQNGAATAVVQADTLAARNQEAAEIAALCREHNMAERASEFIAAGLTRDQVAGRILAATRASAPPPTTPAVPDISPRERRPYSMARALLAMDPETRMADAGYEREVSQEIARTLGRKPRGLYVSTLMGLGAPQAAGLDSHTSNAGTEVVFTEPGSFIELLRKRAMVIRLGASVFPGLQGDVSFPKQTGAGTASWVAENPGSDVADTNLTLDSVTLSPKTLQSTTSYSRQLLAQANINIEALVRADLATIHALAVDLAAIAGTAADNQPRGILNTSGIGDVALGTNGDVPTFEDIVDLETEITKDDADIGTMAYLTTAAMRGLLKKTEMFNGTNGMPIWTGGVESGQMNGYSAYASNQVPSNLVKASSGAVCHAILFGVWPQLLIGEWGALDLIVDPYRLKKQNMIEVTSFQLVDIAVRHAEAFAAIQDAKLS